MVKLSNHFLRKVTALSAVTVLIFSLTFNWINPSFQRLHAQTGFGAPAASPCQKSIVTKFSGTGNDQNLPANNNFNFRWSNLLTGLFIQPHLGEKRIICSGHGGIRTTNTIEEMKIHHSHIAKTKSIRDNGNINGFMNTSSLNSKVVILTFGDTEKSQSTTAKPILDQYGYKASFFITCNYVGDENQTQRLDWNDIVALRQDGQDIESKGMTHADLNNLSSGALDYEIGGSKQCLQNHGISSPNIFAAVHGDAWNNPAVIDTISKYYEYADNGFAKLMFLHCDGYDNKQTDCRTYDDGGTLSDANRYSIREESHNAWDARYLHNDQIIFQKFVKEVNSGAGINNNKGIVDAIPIVAYHIIDNSKDPSSTDINLFATEMKYLHDNDFKVIPMSDLGYDETTNSMYIKE